MKILILFLSIVSAGMSFAQNYVAFVNVNNAVKDDFLSLCLTNDLRGLLSVDARPEKAERIDAMALLSEAAKGYPKGERQIAVYLVNSPDFPPQCAIPQHLSIINLRGLDKGADAKLYKKRIYKMMLKGLAFACGFGATMDRGSCVMGIGSFDTLEGIDKTYDSYSPFCYMPLCSYLNQRGLVWKDPEFD